MSPGVPGSPEVPPRDGDPLPGAPPFPPALQLVHGLDGLALHRSAGHLPPSPAAGGEGAPLPAVPGMMLEGVLMIGKHYKLKLRIPILENITN